MNMYQRAKHEFKLRFWSEVLQQCDGEVREAAKITGVYRTDVYKHLNSLGLKYKAKAYQARRGNWGDLHDDYPAYMDNNDRR